MTTESTPERRQGSVVVVSPHPDDLEIGCGGTVARYRADGRRVVSVVVTDGRRSPRSTPRSDADMAVIRHSETLRAARCLDLDVPPIQLGLPDVKTEAHRESARTQLAAVLRGETLDHDLDELFLPHPELDAHETHRLVASLVLEALSLVAAQTPDARPPALWCYEIWAPFPRSDRLEDVTSCRVTKERAIAAHASQCQDTDYVAGVRGLMRYRAVFSNPNQVNQHMDYAEVFVRLPPPPVQ